MLGPATTRHSSPVRLFRVLLQVETTLVLRSDFAVAFKPSSTPPANIAARMSPPLSPPHAATAPPSPSKSPPLRASASRPLPPLPPLPRLAAAPPPPSKTPPPRTSTLAARPLPPLPPLPRPAATPITAPLPRATRARLAAPPPPPRTLTARCTANATAATLRQSVGLPVREAGTPHTPVCLAPEQSEASNHLAESAADAPWVIVVCRAKVRFEHITLWEGIVPSHFQKNSAERVIKGSWAAPCPRSSLWHAARHTRFGVRHPDSEVLIRYPGRPVLLPHHQGPFRVAREPSILSGSSPNTSFWALATPALPAAFD